MLLQVKKDIEQLFSDVDSFSNKQFDAGSLSDLLDARISGIQESLSKVDVNYNRNFAVKIIALQQIHQHSQDLKHSLDITTPRNISSTKRIMSQLIKEDSNRKVLERKILEKIEGITEPHIDDVENYAENQFEGLNILRLYQIYCNEVDILQASLMELLKLNEQRFNILYQSFEEIINDQQFLKIKNSIQCNSEIVKLLEKYSVCLKSIIKQDIDRSIQMKSLKGTKSQGNLEELYDAPNRYEGTKLPQVEIKNKRKESSSETCIGCNIF